HPRNYGAFPRVIAKYVRELKVLSLSEAIRKMTSLPARKLGLHDRGLLRPGFKADIVVFNYYTVRDKATFENPHAYSAGIEYLLVNGELVIRGGKHTGAKPGRLLRRS
ncbi:MAG: amidohydrolase family protein, partial [Thermoprotei archaeon]